MHALHAYAYHSAGNERMNMNVMLGVPVNHAQVRDPHIICRLHMICSLQHANLAHTFRVLVYHGNLAVIYVEHIVLLSLTDAHSGRTQLWNPQHRSRYQALLGGRPGVP